MTIKWLVLTLFLSACAHVKDDEDGADIAGTKEGMTPATFAVQIQPFEGFPNDLLNETVESLKEVCPVLIVRSSIPFPASAFYKLRKRYRADSLLNTLDALTPEGMVTIGFASKDISTTKGKYNDWGVMGLGRCPGNACVVSIYRLEEYERTDLFYKLVLHELGHTQGLPHCTESTCFMRDAEGGNPMREETAFCTACESKLKKRGWNIK